MSDYCLVIMIKSKPILQSSTALLRLIALLASLIILDNRMAQIYTDHQSMPFLAVSKNCLFLCCQLWQFLCTFAKSLIYKCQIWPFSPVMQFLSTYAQIVNSETGHTKTKQPTGLLIHAALFCIWLPFAVSTISSPSASPIRPCQSSLRWMAAAIHEIHPVITITVFLSAFY